MSWLWLSGTGKEIMAHARECGKEIFGSRKLGEFNDELSDYSLLKNESFSLSW